MTDLVHDLSPEEVTHYRRVALERQKARQEVLKRRSARAWRVARQAANILREQYHVTRVVVFGSLAHQMSFHEWSDIDLAAWGIPSDLTFRAISAVLALSPEFEINLVDINACSPSLRAIVEQEGKDL